MRRPGVMAPPNLYEHPAPPGLMRASAEHAEPAEHAHPIDLHVFLWAVAAVLAVVELCLELAPG